MTKKKLLRAESVSFFENVGIQTLFRNFRFFCRLWKKFFAEEKSFLPKQKVFWSVFISRRAMVFVNANTFSFFRLFDLYGWVPPDEVKWGSFGSGWTFKKLELRYSSQTSDEYETWLMPQSKIDRKTEREKEEK